MANSSFFGLNVALQGLYTAQTNLDITNHNISNAETEGYSRQYSVQEASRPLTSTTAGMIGTGSQIIGVERHRDVYLDTKFWDMNDEMGEYDVKFDLLSQMELLFNEPSDTGFSVHFNEVFDALQTLSTNPSDRTFQTNYVNSIDVFADFLNDMGERLWDIQKDANFGIKNTVDQINFIADSIASINQQIKSLELGNRSANDLRDKRNLLLDDLSKLVNIDVETVTDINGVETMIVDIEGQNLVRGPESRGLELVPRKTLNNPEDYANLYDIYWDSGQEFYIAQNSLSGELKGYVDIRDGNNGEFFRGDVTGLAGAGNTTLTLNNSNRTDIPQSGEMLVNGAWMRYSSYTYNELADEFTFEFGAPAASDGGTATGEDRYGDPFTGVISWDAANQVRITNPLDQELEPKGTIDLGGTVVSYNGYSKDPVTFEITLNIDIDPATLGTQSQIGDDLTFKGVPYYIEELNEFVRTFAQTVNRINESGNGGTGTQIFVYEGYTGAPPLDVTSDYSYEAIDVFNFKVSDEVLKDPSLVEHTADPLNGESANDLTLALLNIRHDATMYDRGEPEGFMEALIGELGIDARQNISLQDGQNNLLRLVENQRLSVSSVDLNEESVNMVKYQQAYTLSAQIISVMSEIYDVTINRMGL